MQQMIANTLANRGGTFRNGVDISQELTSGYVVGGIMPSVVVPVDDIQTLTTTLEHFTSAYDVVGTWLHDGMVHVDAVEIYLELEDALEAGKSLGEIAIWNIAAQEEITL